MGMLAHGTPKAQDAMGEGRRGHRPDYRKASLWSFQAPTGRRQRQPLAETPARNQRLSGLEKGAEACGGARGPEAPAWRIPAPSSGIQTPPAGPQLPSGGWSGRCPPPADTAARDARELAGPVLRGGERVRKDPGAASGTWHTPAVMLPSVLILRGKCVPKKVCACESCGGEGVGGGAGSLHGVGSPARTGSPTPLRPLKQRRSAGSVRPQAGGRPWAALPKSRQRERAAASGGGRRAQWSPRACAR